MEIDVTGTEAKVCQEIAARQSFGMNKYGISVRDNPLAVIEWLQHLKEELLDASVYAHRLIEELRNRQDDHK